ncbi:hypothetical protein [Aeromicrobium sp. Leaf291]|uniref:hypothetical protein n=1 Tax=Aeromicrobium sp. Leaf291 TaxID=1736325 RepID=UPI000B191F91|nr:hypothetical protein [Aeromicrobium sp. Leaf291]
MTHADEYRAALHKDPATNRDDRPDPADYAGSADGPSDAVYSATEAAAETVRWGDPICPECREIELRYWDVICGRCQDEHLEDEAHERGKDGWAS